MTQNMGYAQKYVPFKILVPPYVPKQLRGEPYIRVNAHYEASPPETSAELMYNDEKVGLSILQTDTHLLPLEPEVNPKVQVVRLSNTPVSIYEFEGPGFEGQFLHGGRFFVVYVMNLPRNELIKVIESLLKQQE